MIMKALSTQLTQKNTLTSILIDLGALTFIYLVPTISHIINLPVYLIEPMRLMLIFALVHTHKTNAFIIALTMPLFSFLVSGHPVFPKMLLIAFELSLNVYLFYYLAKKIKSVFPAILLSIILSKVIYYLLKFGLVSMAVIDGTVISTPLTIQLVTTIVFSSYLYLFYRKTKVG
jgi:hypothetical protein